MKKLEEKLNELIENPPKRRGMVKSILKYITRHNRQINSSRNLPKLSSPLSADSLRGKVREPFWDIVYEENKDKYGDSGVC